MKLTYAATLLFDDITVFARDFAVNGQTVVQRQERLRAARAAFADRGNKFVEIRFSVRRHHDTVAAAEAHVLTHPLAIMGSGAAVFTLGAGAGETTYTAAAAHLSCTGTYAGLSTTFDYTILAPEILEDA